MKNQYAKSMADMEFPEPSLSGLDPAKAKLLRSNPMISEDTQSKITGEVNKRPELKGSGIKPGPSLTGQEF